MKTLPIGPFLGINNRLPDYALQPSPQNPAAYLRDAVNVDIDNAGLVRRRTATKLLAGTPPGVHSLRMRDAAGGYAVRAGVLYAVTLPAYSETLVKVLSTDAPLSWAEFGPDLYFSNGTDSGRISSAGIVYPWALPTPSAPVYSLIAGTRHAGAYQVAVAYYNSATGEEGGVSPSSNPELSAPGGLRVFLPGPTTGATHVNIYLTPVNGSVPLLIASVDAATPTYDITTEPTYGREAPQRYEAPLPAGELFVANGRLCAFSGSTVFVGLPFRPGYYLPAEGYIPFPSSVSIALSAQGGTYVAADKTYWIPGDLGDVKDQIADVLPYGAVPGTAFSAPNKTLYGWFGAKGVVLASPAGEVEAVMSDNIALTPPASGRSAIFEGGIRRVVSCGWVVNLDTKAATRYTGFDFTSFSGAYGTQVGGIYQLEAAGLVDAYVDLGKQSFGTEALCRLPAAYAGCSCDLPLLLRVQAPGGVDYSYPARDFNSDTQMQRFDPGKGLQANWFALSVYNQDGADFMLASISFAPTASRRRI